jgi:hypothetical protein
VVVLGFALLLTASAVQAAPTLRPVAWGCAADNDYGQCNVPTSLPDVTAVAAGATRGLALEGNGTVVAWGCGGGLDFGQCSVPNGLSGVTAIAAGDWHSLRSESAAAPARLRKRNKGLVISQSRQPGRVLPAGSNIALVVSRGRKGS